jgi:hypothetical protein
MRDQAERPGKYRKMVGEEGRIGSMGGLKTDRGHEDKVSHECAKENYSMMSIC